jgi:hypothetical protein
VCATRVTRNRSQAARSMEVHSTLHARRSFVAKTAAASVIALTRRPHLPVVARSTEIDEPASKMPGANAA